MGHVNVPLRECHPAAHQMLATRNASLSPRLNSPGLLHRVTLHPYTEIKNQVDRAAPGQGAEDEAREREGLLAAEAVADVPEERPADQDTDEARRDDGTDLCSPWPPPRPRRSASAERRHDVLGKVAIHRLLAIRRGQQVEPLEPDALHRADVGDDLVGFAGEAGAADRFRRDEAALPRLQEGAVPVVDLAETRVRRKTVTGDALHVILPDVAEERRHRLVLLPRGLPDLVREVQDRRDVGADLVDDPLALQAFSGLEHAGAGLEARIEIRRQAAAQFRAFA